MNTVSDLIKAFREDEKDAVAPFLWSDDKLVRAVNGALAAFCEQTRIVYDEIEADFAAGERDLPLSESILDIVEASIVTPRERELEVVAPGVIPRSCLPRAGYPRYLIADVVKGQMRIVPTPAEAGSLVLSVVRKPLREVNKGSNIPDVPSDYRPHLLHYMRFIAYMDKDGELYDPDKAMASRALFDNECQSVYEAGLRRRSAASRPIRFRW